jgi:hypothetical protein
MRAAGGQPVARDRSGDPDREREADVQARHGGDRVVEERRAPCERDARLFGGGVGEPDARKTRRCDRDAAKIGTAISQVAGAPHEAADRAFSVILKLIDEGQANGVLEPGEPERIGLLLFATMQGIAALLTAGIVAPEQVDSLVADAVGRFLHGARAPA